MMRMKRFLATLLFGGLFLCGMVLLDTPAFADSSPSGLTVSPAFQEMLLDQAEQEKVFFVSVTNNTHDAVILRLSVYDFGGLDESGGVAFLGASNNLEKKYSLASWMRPEKDVVTLEPGETQRVRVTIENRESLGPGGHYGALTFKTEGDTRADMDNSIAVNQLFSTLVFVKKIGGEVYGLDLRGNELAHNLAHLPGTVRLRFQNTGNVHVVPRGIITISDPLGRVVRKGIVNEESGIILPETLRAYSISLKSVRKSFIPGKYTLSISYRYDGKETFETSSMKLGIFVPMPILIIGVAMAAIAGWYIVRVKRKGKQRI